MCAACCVASRCVASRRILLCVTRLFLASPKKVSEDELQWHLDSSGDVCVGVWPALANGHGCSGLFFRVSFCVAGKASWPLDTQNFHVGKAPRR